MSTHIGFVKAAWSEQMIEVAIDPGVHLEYVSPDGTVIAGFAMDCAGVNRLIELLEVARDIALRERSAEDFPR